MRYVVLLALVAVVQSAYGQASFPAVFKQTSVIGQADTLGIPISIAVSSDGAVYVADYALRKVLRYEPDGRLRWKIGQRGRGPGELQLPTRVVAMSDGSVLVYDQGQDRFTQFEADGRHRSDHRLDVPMRQMNNVVSLPNGGLAISGILGGERPDTFGIHVFDKNFKHIRSFGPLPPLLNEAVRPYAGAGALTLTPSGELLYAPRYPYIIYRFGVDGLLKSVFSSSLPLKGRPDDAFSLETANGRTAMRSVPGVVHPRPAIEIGDGVILAGRIGQSVSTLDAFSKSGKLLGVLESLPVGWKGPMAYDSGRNLLWVIGAQDDEPVLLRVALAATGKP